jgi:hypothetical protein
MVNQLPTLSWLLISGQPAGCKAATAPKLLHHHDQIAAAPCRHRRDSELRSSSSSSSSSSSGGGPRRVPLFCPAGECVAALSSWQDHTQASLTGGP